MHLLAIPKDMTVKTPAINIAVAACAKDIGVISCNIQDDIVIAAAIATITLIVFIASELDIFNFATLSNATDIKTIDKPSPTTDRKSTSPTNLC
jgi:hypothetical protein